MSGTQILASCVSTAASCDDTSSTEIGLVPLIVIAVVVIAVVTALFVVAGSGGRRR